MTRAWMAVFAMTAPLLLAAQEPKQKLTLVSDLPAFSYPAGGSAAELVEPDQRFAQLAVAMRRYVESVLARYEIVDKDVLSDLVRVEATVDLLEGRDADAVKEFARFEDLADSPSKKLAAAVPLAMLGARAKHRDRNSAEYRREVARRLRAELDAEPFDAIGTDIRHQKESLAMPTRERVIGLVQSSIDPAVKQNGGTLDWQTARALLGARFLLDGIIPLRETLVEVYGRYLWAHQAD